VPAFILFGYYFAVMKLYALFTLHEVRNPFLLTLLTLLTLLGCRLDGVPAQVSVTPLLQQPQWTKAPLRPLPRLKSNRSRFMDRWVGDR
jgi:hypothetical protein